jgi:TorA maturation chaperone TorD
MELFRALGALCERPGTEIPEVAAALELPRVPDAGDYADLFALQLYPYASVYVGAEGMLGGEARDRVAGFWRALALDPPAEPDHLAALLGLYASLTETQAAEREEARALLVRESRRALLWEHLLSWTSPFLAKVDELAPPPYRRWADILGRALEEETAELPEPELLPLHLREAPPPEPGLESLLAPVRSGIILARDDLTRIAGSLGLGTRVAERRYALRALLEQDAAGALDALAGEAERWATIHATGGGRIGEFWRGRAEATARMLREAPGTPAQSPLESG